MEKYSVLIFLFFALVQCQLGERISVKKCKEYASHCKSAVKTTDNHSQTAGLGEFPHMALLGMPMEKDSGFNWYCGGALISESYVLTAAHCVNNVVNNKPTKVRLGEHNLKSDKDGAHPQEIQISKIITHPDYKTSSKYHDIALLQLEKPVTIDETIRPICLWTKHNLTVSNAIATGWGKSDQMSQSMSDVLKKIYLPIVTNDACKLVYPQSRKLKNSITQEILCAGGVAGKDTCQGDGGGPLQFLDGENHCSYHQIGIISFGKACWGGFPSAYTRVSSYVDWIESVVWP